MKTLIVYFLLVTSFVYGEIVSMKEVFPGQHRYSSLVVQATIKKKVEKGTPLCGGEKGIPVVKAWFGYVLIDGHHDVIANLTLGAEELMIRVVADLSALEGNGFWDEMEKQGWAYLYDLKGNRNIPPREFHLLEDDPNRYFVALTARRYADSKSAESSGAEYPLWIKIGKDIPFIEFKIADILWRHGIVYENEMGINPPEEFVEEARRVLIEANNPEFRIVPQRKHFSELGEFEALSSSSEASEIFKRQGRLI